jgi:NAD-dependent deacetylase
MIGPAMEIVSQADICMVIGTSMVVYPAAGLINYVKDEASKYYIDPKAIEVPGVQNLKVIKGKAGEMLPEIVDGMLRN